MPEFWRKVRQVLLRLLAVLVSFIFLMLLIDFLRRVVYVAVGFLPKLPHNGAVLRFLEGIEPQGRPASNATLRRDLGETAGKNAGAGAIGQVRHQQRRPPAGGRNPRRQLPALRLPRDAPFIGPGRYTAGSTSTTPRISAKRGGEYNCAAQLPQPDRPGHSTWP